MEELKKYNNEFTGTEINEDFYGCIYNAESAAYSVSVDPTNSTVASNMLKDKTAVTGNEYKDNCHDDHDLHTEQPDLGTIPDAEDSLFKSVLETSSAESSADEEFVDLPLNSEHIIHNVEWKAGNGSGHTHSEIVNTKELRLKCTDETTDKKAEDEDVSCIDPGSPLDVSRFLKKLHVPNVHHQVQRVYMLHSFKTLNTPVAESLKSPTEDPTFPQDCNIELMRLKTYVEYPHDCPVFVIKLAAEGFIYRPERRTIDCNYCRISIPLVDLYKPGFDPLLMHQNMKPDCPFTQGVGCNNVPFPTTEQLQKQGMISLSHTAVTKLEVNHCPAIPMMPFEKVKTMATPNGSTTNGSMSLQCQVDLAKVTPSRAFQSLKTDSTPSNEQPQMCPTDQKQYEYYETVCDASGHARPEPQRSAFLPSETAARSNTSSSGPNNKSDTNNSSSTLLASSSASSNNLPNSTVGTAATQGTITKHTTSNENATANNSQPKEKKKLTYSDLGIYAEKPKRTDMAVMVKRIQSFLGHWNKNLTQTPEMLAEAGMHYAGYGDCARCFFCGGGLKNWEAPDNPWVEHARWFPKCTYLRMCKGPMFVEIVQRKNKNKEDITIRDVESEINIKYSETESTTGQSAKNSAVSGTRPNTQNGTLAASTSQVGTVDLAKLEAEQEELKSQVMCKICMDEESSVVFLPCGHLVACTHCAIALKNCPLCRAEIKGSVKAHMS